MPSVAGGDTGGAVEESDRSERAEDIGSSFVELGGEYECDVNAGVDTYDEAADECEGVYDEDGVETGTDICGEDCDMSYEEFAGSMSDAGEGGR